MGGDLNKGWQLKDAFDAYYDEKAKNELLITQIKDLSGELAYVRTTKTRWIAAFSIVCFFLLGAIRTVQTSDSPSRPVATDKKAPAPSQQAQATSTPLGASPRAALLPCTQGKWVTLLGAWDPKKGSVDDLFRKLHEIQQRAGQNGVTLPLNYTLLDERQCDTLKKNLYILWAGPYPSGAEAISVCHRLGWKNSADDHWCYAVTIDPTASGKRRINPNEGLPSSTSNPLHAATTRAPAG